MSYPIPLTIAQITIRQDAEGRYCLNDLHLASGREKRHQTSNFLRREETKAIINELLTPHIRGVKPVVSEEGRYGATYVVKQLVYSYAMWLSPKFHLQVVDAYDALVTGALDEVEQHLNESYQYRIQNEKYWLNRYPHWVAIRAHVLSGERYRDIAAALSYSIGRVVRAVKSMIRVGLLSPAKVAEVQHGASKRAALRQTSGWGQMALALEGGAA